MTVTTLILDNDPCSANAARAALAAYPELEIARDFRTSGELFQYLEEHPAHLLFLDIELDEESGFDTARRLRREYPELMVVFLTGHSSYAIAGYDFHPVGFLTKPINPVKLRQTVEEVKRRRGSMSRQSEAKLMFHLKQGGYRILDVRDICCIERSSRKNFLYTETEALRIMNYTVRELDEMLSPHGFFLSHQSFILSLYRVSAVRDVGRRVYEADLRGFGRAVPISRNRYDELLRRLEDVGVRPVLLTK